MMNKIKSIALWKKLLISIVLMAIAGGCMYYAAMYHMPPYVASATLEIAPENIPEGTDLSAKPVTELYKRQIKLISAGRPASGLTLTQMYIEVYGEEAFVCPSCGAKLPAETDISKKFTCQSCSTDVETKMMAQPFKDAMVKVTDKLRLSGDTGIVFTSTGNNKAANRRMVGMLAREADIAITQQAAKDYPDRAEQGVNQVSEAQDLGNSNPRTLIFAFLAATVLGMVCYMVFTTSASNVAFRKLMAYTLLAVLTVLCLFFFYILFVNSTRTHSEIQTHLSLLPGCNFVNNWKSLMADITLPIWSGMLNSLIISACCALLSTYFSTLTAYAIHAYQFKLRNFAFKFILLVMMVPGQVSALGFVEMMNGWNWNDTFWPLILPSIAAPAVFFFMKQYMESALPLAIVEAARIDGSSEFGTFNRIVLHIMKPAIAVQAIFTFVSAWNNYFTPALLLKKDSMKTLPILIAQLRSADYTKFDMGKVYMMICLSILPVILVYLCLSKYIIAGVAVGGVKE